MYDNSLKMSNGFSVNQLDFFESIPKIRHNFSTNKKFF